MIDRRVWDNLKKEIKNYQGSTKRECIGGYGGTIFKGYLINLSQVQVGIFKRHFKYRMIVYTDDASSYVHEYYDRSTIIDMYKHVDVLYKDQQRKKLENEHAERNNKFAAYMHKTFLK